MRRNSNVLTRIFRALFSRFGPQGWWPGRTRFEMIVGAILTQNTAWTNVEKAIRNLRAAGLLSPSRLHGKDSRSLALLIKPAGYYNLKAKRLKNFTDFLFSKYGGSLDRFSRVSTGKMRRDLLSINGIGNETCDSILLYAFNRPVFVVDAYTKRIFSRHGFFRGDEDYEEIREFFMKSLPLNVKLYNEYHALIVKLGKDLCRTKPSCGTCPLNIRPFLPVHQ